MTTTQIVSRSKSVTSAVLCGVLSSPLCMASVESSLSAVQSKLINTVLPLAGIVGLAIAGLSFVAGHENARGRLMLAIVGAVIGFGAPSIIDFIRGLIH